jgi:hypothetical protein
LRKAGKKTNIQTNNGQTYFFHLRKIEGDGITGTLITTG